MAGTRADAEEFVARWSVRGDENGDTQLFWIDLFQNVLGVEDALERLRFEVPVHTDSGSSHAGYIDVLVPSASALVEQKGAGVDLDRPEERQGRMVTPAEQGRGYAVGLPLSQQPRYVIACNFREMRVYDRNRNPLCTGDDYLDVRLEDLPHNLAAIQFLKGVGEAPESVTRAVSVEAGRIMSKIHAQIAALYHDPDSEESHHALSVLCTRLMFLMFCEDAGLIEPGLFHDYVQASDARHLRRALLDLFRWLDMPDEARADEYPDELMARFPYMDGGLFREQVQVPQLDESVRTAILVEGCQEFDWSGVDPTVFGSIFEGALSHDARRAGGMHYTSPENIHKVIDPLFLDDLKSELDGILAERTPSVRTRKLRAYHDRLGGLTFLDPACGSGNFLTETYVCLRRLENRVLMELQKDGQSSLAFEGSEESPVKVTLANFHGIEVNDFACCVARTALWIAEKQADINTAKVIRRVYDELPLRDYDTIRRANALRIDWNDVVSAEGCDYIMGNPPFLGGMQMSREQKADMAETFGRTRGVGELDYVCAWYAKAASYITDATSCAFVSTNSICQGLSVGTFWRYIKEQKGCDITFARRTFVWDSQADDQAHVHCVIVGFHKMPFAQQRLIYDKDEKAKASNINGYLFDASDVYVTERSNPISDVPAMRFGSMPRAKGFTLTPEQRDEFIAKNSLSEKWIRPFWGAQEFLNRKERYCLWLVDADPLELTECPLVMERVEQVRSERAASKAAATRKLADTPTLFAQIAQPEGEGNYLLVPCVSSERRRYVPIGFVSNEVIASNLAYLVPGATLYHFGVMSSQFHNAWMRMVAGRMKSDYRYAKDLVYNTFVWPEATDEQRLEVERCAQAVLDAREKWPEAPLGKVYTNLSLFTELAQAHRELDAAVEAAYGVDFGGDEQRIVAHLFTLYAERAGA